jgi:hypothetical protein
MTKRWNTRSTFENGNYNNPLSIKEKGYDIEEMASGNQTLKQYIKRFNRDKIIFLVGKYEVHIMRDKAVHNLAGPDIWTNIPMTCEIYVNDNSRFIQITSPEREKGDKIDIILEYAGSLMI